MPNLKLMLRPTGQLAALPTAQAAARAAAAWRRIQDKPSEIVFFAGDVFLPAQTVRLEYASRGNDAAGAAGNGAGMRQLTIFGVRDHPDPSVPDTDLARGYLLALADGAEYRIVDVMDTIGERQATAERVS